MHDATIEVLTKIILGAATEEDIRSICKNLDDLYHFFNEHAKILFDLGGIFIDEKTLTLLVLVKQHPEHSGNAYIEVQRDPAAGNLYENIGRIYVHK